MLTPHLERPPEIESVHYFTALVKGPGSRSQVTYLSALQAHSPRIRIVLGHFLEKPKRGPLIRRNRWGRIAGLGKTAEIMASEEKHTDASIVGTMVRDANRKDTGHPTGDYDLSCLISNDGDMAFALREHRQLGQRVVLVTPVAEASRARVAERLRVFVPERDRIPHIAKADVRGSLLPPRVGKFKCPRGWRPADTRRHPPTSADIRRHPPTRGDKQECPLECAA